VSDGPAAFSQRDWGIRFEWGLAGARAVIHPDAAVVVVDVLSFSTAVTIAVGRGTAVYPHRWPSPDAEAFALAHRAVCAVRRRAVDAAHPWSLSPSHLLSAPTVDRLVLPSPNGSAIAAEASADTVLAACLRNATAVAQWLSAQGFGQPDRPVVVIAAGERWPDGELRPALEDLLGAGAIIGGLPSARGRSPEAAAAEAAWLGQRDRLGDAIRSCSSGRELIAAGYGPDVDLASQSDTDAAVPLRIDGAFILAPSPENRH
jgi:2-phosphosulfolactate phosphatase